MQARTLLAAAAASLATLACGSATAPSSLGNRPRRVHGRDGATIRPAALGAGLRQRRRRDAHPSELAELRASPLQAFPPDRYEIALTDVPVNMRVSFRVNDQNSCDENPTGAVTRNVFANGVRLIQNTTTPGSGDEPGYALAVAPDGTISQP